MQILIRSYYKDIYYFKHDGAPICSFFDEILFEIYVIIVYIFISLKISIGTFFHFLSFIFLNFKSCVQRVLLFSLFDRSLVEAVQGIALSSEISSPIRSIFIVFRHVSMDKSRHV